MDIVYTFKKNENCEEIIYSLRSLINLPHDKVVIVGDWPEILNQENVYYIPVEQENNKYQNTLNSLKIVCSDNKISDDFILMNDDFFIMSPIKNIEELNCNYGTLEENILRYEQKKFTNNWFRGLKETYALLKKIGIYNPLNFELHIPFIVNKKYFLIMLETPGIEQINFLQKRSLYGNLFSTNSTFLKDPKIFNETEFELNKNNKFLSCSEKGWKIIKPFISTRFNTKSIYEN